MCYDEVAQSVMRWAAWTVPAVQLLVGAAHGLTFGLKVAPSATWALAFAFSCLVSSYFYRRSVGRPTVAPGPVSVSPESYTARKVLGDLCAFFCVIVATSVMLADRPERAFWMYFG
jgi:hypothetical protein